MTVTIGPSWPGRIIAAWMLRKHVRHAVTCGCWYHRPAVPASSASTGLWQPHLVLRLRISEQQPAWEPTRRPTAKP